MGKVWSLLWTVPFGSVLDTRWTCQEGMWVWSWGEARERGRTLWVICVHVGFESMSWWYDGLLGRNSSAEGLGRYEEPDKQPVKQVQTRAHGEFLSGSCAGVTTCVSLSWASSRASGGPSPSSAGSVTEPSVSCCRPSTFPTCTVCGKALLVGSWLQDRGLHFPQAPLSLQRAQVCPGDRAEPQRTSLLT